MMKHNLVLILSVVGGVIVIAGLSYYFGSRNSGGTSSSSVVISSSTSIVAHAPVAAHAVNKNFGLDLNTYLPGKVFFYYFNSAGETEWGRFYSNNTVGIDMGWLGTPNDSTTADAFNDEVGTWSVNKNNDLVISAGYFAGTYDFSAMTEKKSGGTTVYIDKYSGSGQGVSGIFIGDNFSTIYQLINTL